MSQGGKKWMKPNDLMRTRQLRRRTISGINSKKAVDSKRPTQSERQSLSNVQADGDAGRKRKNPFEINSSSTRRKVSEAEDKQSSGDTDEDAPIPGSPQAVRLKGRKLFTALDRYGKTDLRRHSVGAVPCRKVLPGLSANTSVAATPSASAGCAEVTSREKIAGAEDSGNTSPSLFDDEESAEENLPDECMPLDWSLKGKGRLVFYSDLLPSHLHTPTRHAALTQFMLMEPAPHRKARALMRFTHNEPLSLDNGEGESHRLLFALRQCCHYWVFPSIPGFTEFPRITAHTSSKDQLWPDIGARPDLQEALQKKWLESFGSIYSAVRTGQCPYFYMCCHHFTALFTAGDPTQGRPMSASLTPTTRGLRAAFDREGVEFSLPYQKKKKRDSSQRSKNTVPSDGSQAAKAGDADDKDEDDDDGTDSDDLLATDEGASLWLQDVGLDKKHFPTLQPSKVRIQREGYQQVDGRAESLALIVGGAVQALYNFLTNSRSCIAITGPQAGVPPTILSPSPFQGATIKSNIMQHSLAQLPSSSSSSSPGSVHVMEVRGPLLPHQTLNITSLLRLSPLTHVTLSLSTHTPSLPFNMPQPDVAPSQTNAASSRSDASNPSSSLQAASAVSSHLERAGGREKSEVSTEERRKSEGSTEEGRRYSESEDSRRNSSGGCSSSQSHPPKDYTTPQSFDIYGGLHPSVRNIMSAPSTLKAGSAVRDIEVQNGRLEWSS